MTSISDSLLKEGSFYFIILLLSLFSKEGNIDDSRFIIFIMADCEISNDYTVFSLYCWGISTSESYISDSSVSHASAMEIPVI